jgi:hypothetical protein
MSLDLLGTTQPIVELIFNICKVPFGSEKKGPEPGAPNFNIFVEQNSQFYFVFLPLQPNISPSMTGVT